MTVRWTVRAANDRSRDRAARVEPCLRRQKRQVERLVFFYPLRKQWHIINDSNAIVVSHQSIRTVYHHALACIKNAFAMMIYKAFCFDDMQFLAELMIYNASH